jgi:hypothetical protein
MTPADLLQQKIDRVLHKNRDHIHLVSVPRTPLEALLEAEGGGDQEEHYRLQAERLDIFRALLEFIFQAGPEPLQVLRSIFALAKAVRPELLGDMSLEDISIICADGGRATVSARIQRIYNAPLARAGMPEARASFQKSGTYAAAQRGNSNRAMKKTKKHPTAKMKAKGRKPAK